MLGSEVERKSRERERVELQMAGMTVKEICKLLDLQPHQEGGFFKETFRDSDILLSTDSLPPRCEFLLPISAKNKQIIF